MTPLVILSETRPDEDSLIEDKACVNKIDSVTMARYRYPETTSEAEEESPTLLPLGDYDHALALT